MVWLVFTERTLSLHESLFHVIEFIGILTLAFVKVVKIEET